MAAKRDEDERMLSDKNVASDVDFDDILPHLGEFGCYQKLLFVMMFPFGLFFAFVYFAQIFMTVTPRQHWCWIPELANLSVEHRRSLAIPSDQNSEFGHAQCSMYNTNWSDVLTSGTAHPDLSWGVVGCQHGWEFNHSEIPYATIATEYFYANLIGVIAWLSLFLSLQLGWVCDKSSYQATAQAIFFCGSIFGGLIIGWLADRSGRVPALVASNLFGCIGAVLTVFATNLWQFSICRFIVGMSYDNGFIIMYIIVLEYVGANYRTWAANMSIALFFGSGCIILPWIAVGISNWRTFTLVTGAPMIIVLLAPFLVPESARWLISKGRIDDAIKVIKRFERINGTKVPEKMLEDLKKSASNTSKTEEQNATLYTLFKSSGLRWMFFYIVLVYMACACAFDALVRLSDSLGLDFHLTFTLTSATEIPSVTILTLVLDRFGRRMMTFAPMMISATFCLLAGLLPSGIPSTTAAISGRFFINMAYNAIIQWSAELLPTPIRAAASSAVHISGYIATLLSPFAVYLEKLVPSLSLYVIATTTVIGGLTALLLPESLHRDMPQTIEEGERAMKERKLEGCFGRKRNRDVELARNSPETEKLTAT